LDPPYWFPFRLNPRQVPPVPCASPSPDAVHWFSLNSPARQNPLRKIIDLPSPFRLTPLPFFLSWELSLLPHPFVCVFPPSSLNFSPFQPHRPGLPSFNSFFRTRSSSSFFNPKILLSFFFVYHFLFPLSCPVNRRGAAVPVGSLLLHHGLTSFSRITFKLDGGQRVWCDLFSRCQTDRVRLSDRLA